MGAKIDFSNLLVGVSKGIGGFDRNPIGERNYWEEIEETLKILERSEEEKALIRALKHYNPTIKAFAAKRLGEIAGGIKDKSSLKEILKELKKAINEEDTIVRYKAAEALAKLLKANIKSLSEGEVKEAIEFLIEFLKISLEKEETESYIIHIKAMDNLYNTYQTEKEMILAEIIKTLTDLYREEKIARAHQDKIEKLIEVFRLALNKLKLAWPGDVAFGCLNYMYHLKARITQRQMAKEKD